MKKVISIILIIINIVILSLLIISFNFNKVIARSVSNTIFKNNYKEPNIVINKSASDSRDLIKTDDPELNKILQSDEVQGLIEAYLNKTISSIDDPSKIDDIDFEGDAIEYIKDNREEIEKATGVKVTDEVIDKASHKLSDEDFNSTVKSEIKKKSNSLSSTDKELLKIYRVFISNWFRIVLIILFIINMIIIGLLKKNIIKSIGIIMSTSGVVVILVSVGVSGVVKGLSSVSLSITPLIKCGGVIFILGVIVLILYNIFKRKKVLV